MNDLIDPGGVRFALAIFLPLALLLVALVIFDDWRRWRRWRYRRRRSADRADPKSDSAQPPRRRGGHRSSERRSAT